MTAAAPPARAFRWLLGAQVAIAGILIVGDLVPAVPDLLRGSDAPQLDMPVAPGDQTRRYRPSRPSQPGPGIDPDMPRRLIATRDGDTLLLRGAITPGDAARVLPEIGSAGVGTVSFDSPGGSVTDALAIGEAVREAALTSVLGAGAVCLSACPYAFAGGVARTVHEDAAFGVHQHSFDASTILPAALAASDIQRGQARVLRHLDRMGVDLRLMGPAMETPADEIYLLVREELEEWRVVTD